MARSQIVDNSPSNSPFPKLLSHRFMALRFLCCLLFFFGVLAGTASAADSPSAPAAFPRPGLSFSIADFDGDSKPDLASVETGKSDLARTDYSIQLQFSAAGRQTFEIVAPVGGLRIVARDVNGDHTPDLILTTTWFGQPVAILLNDGHGSFSREDPAAFPEAFSESEAKWLSNTTHATDAIGAFGGGLQPMTQAILADTFPPAQRGLAFALYGITIVCAPAIGPTLGRL
jgi:MFS transporter